MMNEQIKLLAEQAGFVLWKDEDYNPGDIIDWSSRYDNELQKFSELLIAKCIEICNKVSQDADIKTKNKFLTEAGIVLHEGIWAGAKDCQCSIKNYFESEQ
jgi:hypothetical protein